MCYCRPCARLRACTLLHPPLVVFFVSVVTLALTFVSFGGYVRSHSVRDADGAQDWDSFLQGIGSLHLCPAGNRTDGLTAGNRTDGLIVRGLIEAPGNVSTLIRMKQSRWYSATDRTGLRMSLPADQGWMNGLALDARLVITVFPVEESRGCNATDANCSVNSCVALSGPQHLLPKSRTRPQCALGDWNPAAFLDLHAVTQKSDVTSDCFRFEYYGDPELKSLIPQAERTLCAERLLRAALSLLFLAAGFCMLSLLCIQPLKEKRVLGLL